MHAFAAVAVILGGIACAPGRPPAGPAARTGEAPAAPAAGARVELRLDETRVLEDGALELRWVEVSDSRCPIGVTCIWAGQAEVDIEARERGAEARRVHLVLGPKGEAEAALEHHLLRLEKVEPHPREGRETRRDEYRAVVAVEPR